MPQRLVWNPFPTQWWSNWRVSPVKECQCWNAPWLKNNPLSSFPYQFNGSGPLLAYISARPTGGCTRRAIHCISLKTSEFCGHASPALLLQLLTNRFVYSSPKFCNQSKDFASSILATRNNYCLNWLKYFYFYLFFIGSKSNLSTEKDITALIKIFESKSSIGQDCLRITMQCYVTFSLLGMALKRRKGWHLSFCFVCLFCVFGHMYVHILPWS